MKNRILTLLATMCVAVFGAKAQTSYFSTYGQNGCWYDTATVKVSVYSTALPYLLTLTSTDLGVDTSFFNTTDTTTETVFRGLSPNLYNVPMKLKVSTASGADSVTAYVRTSTLESMLPETYSVDGDNTCTYNFVGSYTSKDLPSEYWWKIVGVGVASQIIWESPHTSMPQSETISAADSFDISFLGHGQWYNAYLITQKPFYGRDTSAAFSFYLDCTTTALSENTLVPILHMQGKELDIRSTEEGTFTLYTVCGAKLLEQHAAETKLSLTQFSSGLYIGEFKTHSITKTVKIHL